MKTSTLYVKVVTLLEACHVTGALTNQQRVLAPAARRASAICPANDTSGATYLMMSHVSFGPLDFIKKLTPFVLSKL